MMTDVLFISCIALVLILIAIASIYVVAFVFIGDLKFTNIVIRDSFETSLSKKRKKKRQEEMVSLMNFVYRKEAQRIAGSSDKDIANSLNIKIEEAKKFKKNVVGLLKKKDFSFITLSDVKEYDKINKTYSFINLVIEDVRLLSNPRNQVVIKLVINYLHKEIDEENFKKEIYQIFEDDNYAKQKLKKMKKKNRSNVNVKDFLYAIFDDSFFRNADSKNGLRKLYEKIEMA